MLLSDSVICDKEAAEIKTKTRLRSRLFSWSVTYLDSLVPNALPFKLT